VHDSNYEIGFDSSCESSQHTAWKPAVDFTLRVWTVLPLFLSVWLIFQCGHSSAAWALIVVALFSIFLAVHSQTVALFNYRCPSGPQSCTCTTQVASLQIHQCVAMSGFVMSGSNKFTYGSVKVMIMGSRGAQYADLSIFQDTSCQSQYFWFDAMTVSTDCVSQCSDWSQNIWWDAASHSSLFATCRFGDEAVLA
jgi:hypothetical protein